MWVLHYWGFFGRIELLRRGTKVDTDLCLIPHLGAQIPGRSRLPYETLGIDQWEFVQTQPSKLDIVLKVQVVLLPATKTPCLAVICLGKYVRPYMS